MPITATLAVAVANQTVLQLIPSLGRKKLMFFGRALGRNQVIATILSAGFGKRFDRKKISSATETMKKRVVDRVYEQLKGDGDSQSEIDAAKGRCLLGRKSCSFLTPLQQY